jgi:hypothetical protein
VHRSVLLQHSAHHRRTHARARAPDCFGYFGAAFAVFCASVFFLAREAGDVAGIVAGRGERRGHEGGGDLAGYERELRALLPAAAGE